MGVGNRKPESWGMKSCLNYTGYYYAYHPSPPTKKELKAYDK